VKKLEKVPASEMRSILERMGLELMEGANNTRAEIWLEKSGHPHVLPYFTPNDANYFVKEAVDDLIEKLTS